MAASLTQPTDLITNSASVGAAHSTTHKHGGSDEVATATAAANAIPKAGGAGTLAIGFIPTGSTSSTVCIGNDARLVLSSSISVGTDTLASGTKTVAATVTASSRIFVTQKTAGGTTGTRLQVPSAGRSVGAPGSFDVVSVDTAGATVNTDTSTFDWMVVG